MPIDRYSEVAIIIQLLIIIRLKRLEEPDTRGLVVKGKGIREDFYQFGIDPGKKGGPNRWMRFKNFYHSAVVKFIVHFTFNLFFLGLIAFLISTVDPVSWASGVRQES